MSAEALALVSHAQEHWALQTCRSGHWVHHAVEVRRRGNLRDRVHGHVRPSCRAGCLLCTRGLRLMPMPWRIGDISWSLDDGFFEIELHVLAGLRFEIKMEI